MILHVKHGEIDKVRWDKCISSTPGAKPYGYSWYLDIMVPGWEALVADDYDAVFPLPAFKKFGIKYLTTPTFVQQLGVFSPERSNHDIINEFLDHIPDSFKLIDMRVGMPIRCKGYNITERTNYEIKLSGTYDTIWNNFSFSCKRNVGRSARHCPIIVSDIAPYELICLFRRVKGTIRGIREADYMRLHTLMDFCILNKFGRIVGVRTEEGNLMYGRFFLTHKEGITMLFTSGTAESRKKNMGYFVVNEIIREYSGSEKIFDFEGSSIPSIAAFMKSFGCVNVPYYRIYLNRLPWIIKALKP